MREGGLGTGQTIRLQTRAVEGDTDGNGEREREEESWEER